MTRSPWLRVYDNELFSPFSDSVSLRLRDFYHLTSLVTVTRRLILQKARHYPCLLYTSDAADDLLCVDLGGRRIIKKKKNIHTLAYEY